MAYGYLTNNSSDTAPIFNFLIRSYSLIKSSTSKLNITDVFILSLFSFFKVVKYDDYNGHDNRYLQENQYQIVDYIMIMNSHNQM